MGHGVVGLGDVQEGSVQRAGPGSAGPFGVVVVLEAPEEEKQVEARPLRPEPGLVVREHHVTAVDQGEELGVHKVLQDLGEHRLKGDRAQVAGVGGVAAFLLEQYREAGLGRCPQRFAGCRAEQGRQLTCKGRSKEVQEPRSEPVRPGGLVLGLEDCVHGVVFGEQVRLVGLGLWGRKLLLGGS